MNEDERQTQGLQLFKQLIKDGCQWQGDIISTKWSEALWIPEEVEARVRETCSIYEEGTVWKIKDSFVYLA